MISWEVMKDLAQVSALILGWLLAIGCGITGLTIGAVIFFWVVDFIRKEFL